MIWPAWGSLSGHPDVGLFVFRDLRLDLRRKTLTFAENFLAMA